MANPEVKVKIGADAKALEPQQQGCAALGKRALFLGRLTSGRAFRVYAFTAQALASLRDRPMAIAYTSRRARPKSLEIDAAASRTLMV